MLKKHLAFIGICITALVFRLYLMTTSISPWWDPSIYTGMGKFFFSGGTIGFWETLRPPLWPLIMGIPWLVGFNQIIAAKIIISLFAIATLIYLYYFGEKVYTGLGLAAALILAITPSYSFFSVIPTNDIPSVFFTLIAAYFLMKGRYTWTGVSIALAFLMRFPHGLFLLPFGLFVLIQEWNKAGLKKLGSMVLGFAIFVVPYFIINAIAFGNPILPLILGLGIISGDPESSWTYYFVRLLKDNPLLLLTIVGIVAYIHNVIKTKIIPGNIITLSMLCVLIIGAYFTITGHKELRYSFAFLPYLTIIVGYGFIVLWKEWKWKYLRPISLIIIIIFGIIQTNIRFNDHRKEMVLYSDVRRSYYEFLPSRVNVITSSPQIMTGSDAKVVGIFQSWFYGLKFLQENQKNTVSFDYVAIDSCQVYCQTGNCNKERDGAMSILAASTTRVFDKQDGECNFSIYKFND